MKHFMALLLTILLGLSMSVVYAGGGHRGGHHGGHHRSHTSLYFSYGGYYGNPFYYNPYYYPLQVVVPAPEPVVYVERSAQQEPHYWYYCTEPKGYYPHVEQCPVGWMQVVPHSPKTE